MLLSQMKTAEGAEHVLVRNIGEPARMVNNVATAYALAMEAADSGRSIADVIAEKGIGAEVDIEALAAAGALLPPISHPDPAHLHLTGTGLTHLGSASTRDSMHAEVKEIDKGATDTMKMFQMGLKGGKPEDGEVGVQPEWFYKGNGNCMVAPGAPLVSPSFALDGGEEPELAGIYVISSKGEPFRIGFALSNEFSDHVTERINYLYLAHSKLRPASIGPEIRVGMAPADVRGTSRIRRGDQIIFDQPFYSGEDNMSHSFQNLEHHHFKYPLFRVAGDVHVHMFGTATLSFGADVRTAPGDVFEIEAAEFGLPLVNPLAVAEPEVIAIRQL